MTDFDPREYLNQQVAILCATQEESIECLEFLDSKGYEWISGESLPSNDCWGYYEEETCYDIETNKVSYECRRYFVEHGYTIIEWADIKRAEPIQLSNEEWANILAVAKASN